MPVNERTLLPFSGCSALNHSVPRASSPNNSAFNPFSFSMLDPALQAAISEISPFSATNPNVSGFVASEKFMLELSEVPIFTHTELMWIEAPNEMATMSTDDVEHCPELLTCLDSDSSSPQQLLDVCFSETADSSSSSSTISSYLFEQQQQPTILDAEDYNDDEIPFPEAETETDLEVPEDLHQMGRRASGDGVDGDGWICRWESCKQKSVFHAPVISGSISPRTKRRMHARKPTVPWSLLRPRISDGIAHRICRR
ncbi:uncharacterized protein K489DRAFT_79944 [Dissoconium aciculare CBS 342.82]|uniref:Uncharacterized protein n=1 Tax=Dissoconium aciculare CBS 342.82 TaxID=1314786 RepID=A0A6J3LT20_9PEZI|nr:uncharacterized protein K489DRAFT_79944 [Dissoconium aciculare CBS 342.82]KAF1818793.1 hypothetical protein K489DRAFT_79944 [Dissoconium aciculare CBS 342.82]